MAEHGETLARKGFGVADHSVDGADDAAAMHEVADEGLGQVGLAVDDQDVAGLASSKARLTARLPPARVRIGKAVPTRRMLLVRHWRRGPARTGRACK